MKLLIGTPAFGGMVTTGYAGSLARTTVWAKARGIELQTMLLSNESLIPRARNKIMRYALTSGVTHLLFIDADLEWSPEHIEKLAELKVPVAGGTYPVKEFPIRLNFTVDRKHSDFSAKVPIVRHIPTGFMLIDLSYVEHIRNHLPSFRTTCPMTGEEVTTWDYFPCGPDTASGTYLSEDWGFCELLRSYGIPVRLHTEVVLPHTGTYTFRWNPETPKGS